MTKEQLLEKIDVIFEIYKELSPFTIDFFNNRVGPFCYEDYLYEDRYLKMLEEECNNILQIMRQDLLDHNVLSRLKHNINKRLKTIEDEE